MAEVTAIEWADSTFNPWIGCTKVSPACDHCYAETLMDKRHGRVKWGGERSRTKTWGAPLMWQRNHLEFKAMHGRRQRVFCASLADVFDNQVPKEWRDDLLALIRQCPDLDWLLLTKRPQNVFKMLPEFWSEIAGRIWLGVSTENQEELDRRHTALTRCFNSPSLAWPKVIFASAEPLLGPLVFQPGMVFKWIITGGETGPGARPSNPEWFREIRDYCAANGVAYLHKQNGDWVSVSEVEGPGEIYTFEGDPIDRRNGRNVRRVGKKKAGRTIDGKAYTEFPKQ
jgi:protein gp37